MWAIYSKDDSKPIWKSSDRKSLEKTLEELIDKLGNKFYIDIL